MSSTKSLASHVKKECVVGFFANALINSWLCYYGFKHIEKVGPWGLQGYLFDLPVTGFALASILTLYIAWIHHRKRHVWTLAAPTNAIERITDRLPQGIWNASLCIGLFGLVFTLVFTLGLALVLWALSAFVEFSGVDYAVIKGVATGILAALIVVPMGIRRGLNFFPGSYAPSAA